MVSGKKSCFVIAPIGSEESKTRQRSDLVLKHIIKPATEECGYKAVRADEISEPGIITTQVIQRLIDDDLVIADLTEKNPNVFYELAIRHAIRKPVVQIIKRDEKIPFDVTVQRTIHYDLDLDSAATCREELIKQIHAAEEEPEVVDSPVSTAIDLRVLRESENPVEKSIVEIVPMLEDIRSLVQDLNVQSRDSEVVSKLLRLIFVFNDTSIPGITKVMPPDRLAFYYDYLHFLGEMIDILEPVVSGDDQIFIQRLYEFIRNAKKALRGVKIRETRVKIRENEEGDTSLSKARYVDE
jgi:hypothetical protein